MVRPLLEQPGPPYLIISECGSPWIKPSAPTRIYLNLSRQDRVAAKIGQKIEYNQFSPPPPSASIFNGRRSTRFDFAPEFYAHPPVINITRDGDISHQCFRSGLLLTCGSRILSGPSNVSEKEVFCMFSKRYY